MIVRFRLSDRWADPAESGAPFLAPWVASGSRSSYDRGDNGE